MFNRDEWPGVLVGLGRAADGATATDVALEQQVALGLRQTAPNPVGLTDFEGVRAALLNYRALPAHFLRALLALHAGPATLTVGVEEHR